MTYRFQHLVVRLNGGFPATATPVDRWSCGFRVGIPTQDVRYDQAALQSFANAVHAAAVSLHQSANTAAGTNCSFYNVSVARVGEDGRYSPAAQLTTISSGSTATGAGTPVHPWNTALSFGLRTASPRGYASNGRVYYPMLAATVAGATGRLATAAVQNRVNQFAAFLRAVNTAAAGYDVGAMVCVMSNVGTGTTLPVLSVRSDERLDSIERRENDQPPTYMTAVL